MRIVFAIGLRKSFQISLTLLNIAELQARTWTQSKSDGFWDNGSEYIVLLAK